MANEDDTFVFEVVDDSPFVPPEGLNRLEDYPTFLFAAQESAATTLPTD